MGRFEDLVLLTLPPHLREEGLKLIEEDLKKGNNFTVIGRLILELWSPRMQKHAESLLLQKAIKEGYLEERHLKWVHVLEDQHMSALEIEGTWLIDDQDEAIIELVWNIFNIKEHYSEVHSHRSWVIRSYHRLKVFLPGLHEEIMERHDLSKYPFSQAIGYTLKWVHGTRHPIWSNACDLHLYNEPHHPQAWCNVSTPQEKKNKLLKWVSQANDYATGSTYGLDLNNLDLSTEDLAEPFLLESYVDMVGVEWERKKKKDMNISTRDLAYIEDKFLSRYTKKQFSKIKSLIAKILASDQAVTLTKENILLSTVPPAKRGLCAAQLDTQEKIEESKIIDENKKTLTQRENLLWDTIPSEKLSLYISQLHIQKKIEERRMSKNAVTDLPSGQLSEIEKVMVENKAFNIVLAKVVTEFWDASYKKRIENFILKKAIEEKKLKSNHIDWILVFENKNCTSQMELSSTQDSPHPTVVDESIVALLWQEFNISQHFTNVQQHRHWIKQSYLRLARFMPELPEEVIERHDLTKLSLSQSIGYTLKWVHNINLPVWRKACDIHLNWEPHHPQMWSHKHMAEHKQSCLNKWLGGRDSYGLVMSTLDFHSEDMAQVFLLESLVDMVAVEWERNKGQKQDLTNIQLIYMEDRFLNRYTASDKATITHLMKVIRQADNSP